MRVGLAYFVETPNKWFPIESHFLAPLFHFLPKSIRRRTARFLTPWGWITRPKRADAALLVDEISLLERTELQSHFPDAEVVTERFLGMSKSLLAIKHS
jgi:hypothetical protein